MHKSNNIRGFSRKFTLPLVCTAASIGFAALVVLPDDRDNPSVQPSDAIKQHLEIARQNMKNYFAVLSEKL